MRTTPYAVKRKFNGMGYAAACGYFQSHPGFLMESLYEDASFAKTAGDSIKPINQKSALIAKDCWRRKIADLSLSIKT
jgi:hypothetical protein